MQNMPDYAQMMRIMQSPEGQRLMALLRNTNSAALDSAVSSAQSGDMEAARSALSQILNTPEVRALLKQLGR